MLVPGINIRENFKSELLFTTGETYVKNKFLLEQMSKEEKDRENKISIYSVYNITKFYHIKHFIERF